MGGILHRESKSLFLKMSFAYGLDNNRVGTELSRGRRVKWENTKKEERKDKAMEKRIRH